jgi:hypothetical protein
MEQRKEIVAGENLRLERGQIVIRNIVEQVEMVYQQNQGEIDAQTLEARALEDKEPGLEENISNEEKDKNERRGNAKVKFHWAKRELWIAIPTVWLVSFAIFYTVLAPTQYGKELVAALLATGAAGLTFIAGKVVLHHVRKVIGEHYMNIFISIVSIVMFACLLGGGIKLWEARKLQSEMQSFSDSASGVDNKATRFDPDKTKDEIDSKTAAGLILLFLGIEWFSSVFIYRAEETYRKFKYLVSMLEEKERNSSRILSLKKNIARLTKATKDSIRADIIMAESRKQGNRRKALLILFLVLFFGIILLIFLGKAFGGESSSAYYANLLDISGSRDEYDLMEDNRATVRFINTRKPGDAGLIAWITENTFSRPEPEFAVHFKMPVRPGAYGLELKKAKVQAVKEFQDKWTRIPKKREGTEMLGGFLYYSKLVKEQEAKRKCLLVYSDMRQCAQGINEETIVKKGNEILERLKTNRMIPDFGGTEIFVMGASTNGLSVQEYQKIEQFWTKYFSLSGGTLHYDIGRFRFID